MSNGWTINSALERLKAELDSTVQFWLQYSHDKECGFVFPRRIKFSFNHVTLVFSGFLHCLSREGNVFDTIKYGWMVCRQVWMYAKLYNSLVQYHTPEVLESAKAGAIISSYVCFSKPMHYYYILLY